MSGNSFESDIDLNNVKVLGVEEVIIVNNGYQTLEAKNLMKVYGKKTVVRSVSMKINRGKLSGCWALMEQVKQPLFI